ncbi:MAG: tetratricopeptide repeat protein [Myxococcales bacterium]
MRSDLALALLVLVASASAAAEPLVGAGVGNADLLAAEGSRLYNEKKYEQARDNFLRAARAAPQTLPTYLSLARSYFAAKDLELACQAYRVYLKSAIDAPDRAKAQSESELCDKQLRAKLPTGSALGQQYVAIKAELYDALDKGNLLGPGSARAKLVALLDAGYVAPDLADIAAKIAQAAEKRAEAVYTAASGRQKVAPAELRDGAELYQLALDTGAQPTFHTARIAFMQGLAFLLEGKTKEAEASFAEVVKRDPSNTEARFFRGLAVYRGGDKAGALRQLESELPKDPRTGILKVAASFDRSEDAAATELQRFLFDRRFKQ